jgi:lipid-binding SYLF domain-containing protein
MTQQEMSMTFFSRVSQDASNAFHDAYGNFVLGDDAGKSARLVLVLKPKLGERIDLGMTFIEINGRAYVRAVTPGSHAARAGVMPQDSVQFASVYHNDFDDDVDDDDDDDEDAATATDLVESAASYALACESRGMRITYDDLRSLLAEGLDPMQSAFLSPTSSTSSSWTGPPIPSTINICSPNEDEFHRPLSPFRGETPKPVVFCFRRTRQRSSPGGMHFRLDDECDFATSLIRRLAPTPDMDAPVPDAWDELVHDGADWLLGRDSMMPPRHSTLDANSLRREEDSGIPLDDYERQRAIKIANLRSRMAAEAVHHGDKGDDVEAATIRGMIQKAVGLAFVRASKVVLGVSLHGGSGIVIARLSDGTWSAPSAIGTWGLGFGIQFGLEVAEYIFILQTQESLDHFRMGSSFNIGGNIGAAVAGMGREAYGAASVSNSCGGSPRQQIKDDEYNDDEDNEVFLKDQSSFGIAPIVAYAKSQGLYVGVSLEGSRIFTRSDVNARAYKFSTGRDVTGKDILSGKVATPSEAEDLYAALHRYEVNYCYLQLCCSELCSGPCGLQLG